MSLQLLLDKEFWDVWVVSTLTCPHASGKGPLGALEVAKAPGRPLPAYRSLISEAAPSVAGRGTPLCAVCMEPCAPGPFQQCMIDLELGHGTAQLQTQQSLRLPPASACALCLCHCEVPAPCQYGCEGPGAQV